MEKVGKVGRNFKLAMRLISLIRTYNKKKRRECMLHWLEVEKPQQEGDPL